MHEMGVGMRLQLQQSHWEVFCWSSLGRSCIRRPPTLRQRAVGCKADGPRLSQTTSSSATGSLEKVERQEVGEETKKEGERGCGNAGSETQATGLRHGCVSHGSQLSSVSECAHPTITTERCCLPWHAWVSWVKLRVTPLQKNEEF